MSLKSTQHLHTAGKALRKTELKKVTRRKQRRRLGRTHRTAMRGAEARVRCSGTSAILETSSSRRLASSQLPCDCGPRPFTSPSPAPDRPTASALPGPLLPALRVAQVNLPDLPGRCRPRIPHNLGAAGGGDVARTFKTITAERALWFWLPAQLSPSPARTQPGTGAYTRTHPRTRTHARTQTSWPALPSHTRGTPPRGPSTCSLRAVVLFTSSSVDKETKSHFIFFSRKNLPLPLFENRFTGRGGGGRRDNIDIDIRISIIKLSRFFLNKKVKCAKVIVNVKEEKSICLKIIP